MIRALLTLATLFVAAPLLGAQETKRPWLGMSVRAEGKAERVLHVERVTPEGPSHRSGIRPGDILTKVNGASLQHMDDLEFLLFIGERKPGERVRFEIVRNGTARVVIVTVGVMPASAYAGWQRALHNARQLRLRAQRQAR